MNKLTAILFAAGLLSFTASCGNESGSDTPCSPATLPCPCDDGTSGTRYCIAALEDYGDCVCGNDAGALPNDAGDSADSGTVVDGQPCVTDDDCNPAGPSGFECVAGRCEALEDWNPGPSDADRENWDLVGEGGAPGAQLPFGEALGDFCGVPAYSNGIGTPYSHTDGSTIFGFRWQCTEFAFRFLCLTNPELGCAESGKGGRYGDAKYWFDNTYNNPVLAQLTRFANGGAVAPQPGDVLVLDGTGSGHVAIIREVTDSTIAVIEQNTTRTRADAYTVHRMQVAGGRYTIRGAIGWLRAPSGAPDCADQMPTLLAPADGASVELGTDVRLSWALGEADADHFVKVRELATDTVVLLENIGTTTSFVFTPERAGEYRWTTYYRSDRCPNNECAAPARTFEVIPPADACDDNFCRNRGASTGAFCDGGELIECGRAGDCLVETSRELCSAGNVCENGACVEPPECSPASPCPAQATGAWSACAGYSNSCDETGTRSRSITTYQCDGGTCEAGTETETDSAGCARNTDGATCASGICGGGTCVDSCAEQWRIESHACDTFTAEGLTLIACAEITGENEATFRVRKADGTAFVNSGTMHVRVGERTGNDCPNVSRGSASFAAGQSTVVIPFELVRGTWPAGETKPMFASIEEVGGGLCYRYTPEIEITRVCIP